MDPGIIEVIHNLFSDLPWHLTWSKWSLYQLHGPEAVKAPRAFSGSVGGPKVEWGAALWLQMLHSKDSAPWEITKGLGRFHCSKKAPSVGLGLWDWQLGQHCFKKIKGEKQKAYVVKIRFQKQADSEVKELKYQWEAMPLPVHPGSAISGWITPPLCVTVAFMVKV